MAEDQKYNVNQAVTGLNLDSTITQVKQGQLTYALNAICENFDGTTVTYQNEQANTGCVWFPVSYKVIGVKNLTQLNKVVFFLTNNINSLICTVDEGSCEYKVII